MMVFKWKRGTNGTGRLRLGFSDKKNDAMGLKLLPFANVPDGIRP